MDLQPGTVVDRYTVDSVLGMGGMAVVYTVRHNQRNSLHALKILTLPAQAIRERLMQEGRVQAALRHENIVSVTDVVIVEGAPGLIMEYIEGPTLDQLLKVERLSLSQADELARALLNGVAEAHQHGLIHRDLKPANILLEVTRNSFRPKITDFGLAKLLETDTGGSAATRSGLAMGTPHYMAPEQIRDAKNVDERADLFSLGAILYEIVTGERAFPGEDVLTVFTAVAKGERKPIEDLVEDLPDRMGEAISRALAVEREDRVSSCDELLELWCAGKPLLQAVPGENTPTWTPEFLDTARSMGSGSHPSPQAVAAASAPSSASSTDQTWAAPIREDTDTGVHSQVAAGEPTIVPPVAAQTQVPEPTNSSLTIDAQPAPASQPPAKGKTQLLLFGGVSLVLGGLLAFLALKMLSPEPAPQAADAPVESQAPAEQPQQAPEPEPEPTVSTEAEEAPPEQVEPESVAVPTTTVDATAPEATPKAPPVKPAPTKKAKSSNAVVSVTGDAKRVWFISEAGRFPAGEVAPGTYSVMAFFDGVEPVPMGEITVSAGETRSLKCSEALMVCR